MALSIALVNALERALHGRGNSEELTNVFSATAGQSVAGKAIVADANGNYYQSFADTITAQHTSPSQSTATKLTAMINRITTVTAAADAVALPPAVAGLEIQIINHGANPVQVYGDNTAADKINDVATATGVSQMQGSSCVYSCVTAGNWYAEPLAAGYSGSFPTQSSIDSLTALAGGAQAGATPLTASMNRVVTIVSANDSTMLPASSAGMALIVINAHATNACRVYALTGTDTINGVANGTAFSLAAGKTVSFYCATAGAWHSILSA